MVTCWATLGAGPPGFLGASSERTLRNSLVRDPYDPASTGFNDGGVIGLLGIELHTRRRNRLNGVVSHSTGAGFNLEVTQSFGNCPQYIQVRDASFVRDPASPPLAEAVQLDHLSKRARTMIGTADTFFVASYVDDTAGRQVDVSHHGGKAGFVRIGEDGVLTISDFAGNLFFATLGNFLINPRAGLVFANFEGGDLLQLTGEAEVDLNSPEIAAFQGGRAPLALYATSHRLPCRCITGALGVSRERLVAVLVDDRELGRGCKPSESADPG